MRTKSKLGRVFELPSDQQESDINTGIAEDADTREITDEEFHGPRPLGRPKAEVDNFLVHLGEVIGQVQSKLKTR